MNKKKKILTSLASLAFFLLLYLFIVSENIGVQAPVNQNIPPKKVVQPKVDLVKLENEYVQKMKEIYSQLKLESENLEDISETTQNFIILRDKVVSLTVPREDYKAFHMSMVLLLEKIISGNVESETYVRETLEEIIENNTWLE